jgi:hypothetical protein
MIACLAQGKYLRGRAPIWLWCAAFTVAATYPLTVRLEALYWGDVMLYFLPALEFARRELQAGRVPLWNPFVLCGQPYVGNPQTSLLYPMTLLLPAIAATRYMAVTAAVHVAVAWAGTYRHVRWIGASRLAGALAASTFVGGAAFLSRLQFPTMVMAMAWLPWLLYASERMAVKPSARSSLLLACAAALSLLAGHPQVAYISLILGLIGLLWSERGRPWRVRMAAVTRWSACVTLGCVAATAYWLPTIDVLRLSARPELSLMSADRFVIGWQHLLGLLWPGFLGTAKSGSYWAPGNMWEPALFIGLPQLVLAAYAVVVLIKREPARMHAWVALGSLWLSLGVWGGLYTLAYYAVPGMNVFHDPARFGIPASSALACLAGLGFDAIRPRLGKASVPVCVLSVGLLVNYTGRLTPTVKADELAYRPRLLALGAGGRVYSAVRQETWDRYVNYSEYGPESGRYVHELTDTTTPNIGMRYGIADAAGYEPVPIRCATAFEALLRESVLEQAPVFAQLAAIADVRRVVFPLGLASRHPSLLPVENRRSTFTLAFGGAAPVRLAYTARCIPDDRRALEALGRSAQGSPSAIVSRPVGLPAYDVTEGEASGSAEWHSMPGGGDCRLRGIARRCLLIVAVTAMPGWRITVDGRTVEAVRANVAFLGVPVKAGAQRVRVRYEPAAFRVGLFLTFVGTACIAAIAGACIVHGGFGKVH